MVGHFYPVKPKRTKSSHNAANWVLASYMEFPSQREDGKWYRVFLFRDVDRKVFGAWEFLDPERPAMDPRDWATKIVTEPEYRKQFLTSEKRLIALWKKH
jgi:hypothetical protein